MAINSPESWGIFCKRLRKSPQAVPVDLCRLHTGL